MTQKQITVTGQLAIIVVAAFFITKNWFWKGDQDDTINCIINLLYHLSLILLSWIYLLTYRLFGISSFWGLIRIFQQTSMLILPLSCLVISFPSLIPIPVTVFDTPNFNFVNRLWLLIEGIATISVCFAYKNSFINKYHVFPRLVLVVLIVIDYIKNVRIPQELLLSISFYILISEVVMFQKLKKQELKIGLDLVE